MASTIHVLIFVGAAVVLYSCLGLPFAARIAPRSQALMLAPGLGWAAHSAIALPIFSIIGMSRLTVAAAFAAPLVLAVAVLWKCRSISLNDLVPGRASAAALIGAALLAFAVMAAVLPKFSAEGVSLAAPIFDHSKVAMIDEMMRHGVPPANPFFGGVGTSARLSYYYLWHFSAAELALLINVSAWEADAGLAWFTAFASLSVMIGFAAWLSGRTSSACWVVALAATASVRPLLYALTGVKNAEQVVGYQSGFGGWLFQTSWGPQHTASAMCAVVAVFLLAELIRLQSALTFLLFALVMAAGLASSTWVGGVTFPLAAAPIALFLLARAKPQRRLRVFVYVAAAVLLALLLVSPLLYDQLQMAALRGADGPPIAITPYEVLGESVTGKLGEIANWPAYWLIFLVVEFPAFYLTGLVSAFWLLRDRTLPADRGIFVEAFAMLLGVSLTAAWLLVSTLGDNNDLGWRAVLPAVMLLIVFSAAGLSRLVQRPRLWALVPAVVLILLGVPDAAQLIYGNSVVSPNASSKAFAATPALWQAVRRHTAADERVANNPLFMEHMTPWSVNISWALLSNRRSCYAGAALVGPFTALPQEQRDGVAAQFLRVFAGKAEPGDLSDMARQYNCSVAVVTPQDGAWSVDPFASSAYFRLVEDDPAWRIYKANAPAP